MKGSWGAFENKAARRYNEIVWQSKLLINKNREYLCLMAGFTLIEMLVVIGVTILLSGYVITYTSTSRNQVALRVEEVKIAQTIARAKSLAVSTYNSPEVSCGYGVQFEYDAPAGGRYTLFRYNPPECGPLSGFDPVFRIAIEGGVFTLAPHVNLVSNGDDAIENVLFVPPDPDTYIWRVGGATPANYGTIYLKTDEGSAAVQIKINDAGQITF